MDGWMDRGNDRLTDTTFLFFVLCHTKNILKGCISEIGKEASGNKNYDSSVSTSWLIYTDLNIMA